MTNRFKLSRIAIQTIACLAMVTGLWGCSSNEPAQSNAVRASQHRALVGLTSDQQAQKKLAVEAKDKLFASLLGELMTSMGEKGPAKSIAVCMNRAPEIAEAVSKEMGVRIGRTSFKLRSEANQPPVWSANFVSDRVEEPVEVALPDDGLGVLLPIRLNATCTLCHGSNEQVMPDVKAAIVSSYPNDSATEFSEGDLRGYFWIEVPAIGQTSN